MLQTLRLEQTIDDDSLEVTDELRMLAAGLDEITGTSYASKALAFLPGSVDALAANNVDGLLATLGAPARQRVNGSSAASSSATASPGHAQKAAATQWGVNTSAAGSDNYDAMLGRLELHSQSLLAWLSRMLWSVD